jgi:hypothetical protein
MGATYKLTEKAFIGNVVCEEDTLIGEGTSVPFSGVPGPHMTPMNPDAEKALAAARKQAESEGRSFDLNVMNTVPLDRVDNRGI